MQFFDGEPGSLYGADLWDMKQLRSFSLTTERVASKDYTTIIELENLEYLRLSPRKEVKAIHGRLLELPKLVTVHITPFAKRIIETRTKKG